MLILRRALFDVRAICSGRNFFENAAQIVSPNARIAAKTPKTQFTPEKATARAPISGPTDEPMRSHAPRPAAAGEVLSHYAARRR